LIHQPVVVAGTLGQFYAAAEAEAAVVQGLVKLGASAIPDIDAALDSIEKRGRDSEFLNGSDALLSAYARIKGPAAFPRLRQMRDDPILADGPALDNAASLSLGLTSYVRMNALRRMINVEFLRGMRRAADGSGNRGFNLREALDILISAWEKGDRALLEESLGPNARAALDSLLKDSTWDAMRAQLWHTTLSAKTAVGYRFGTGALKDQKPPGGALSPGNAGVDTLFKDGSGKDCGTLRIQFVGPDLAIDNSDIGDLLRLISICAATQ
jgi:hypothetical protein